MRCGILFVSCLISMALGNPAGIVPIDQIAVTSVLTLPVLEIPKDITPVVTPGGLMVKTQASCFWSGTSPFCAGGCPDGYVDCATDGCGDGACCWTGYKKYCCIDQCPS